MKLLCALKWSALKTFLRCWLCFWISICREREKKKTFFVFMLFKHSITLSVCLSYLHFYVYFPSYQNIGGNWFRKRKYKFCSVWPDLTKFRHFGKSWQIFGKFLTVYFLPGKLLSPPWQIYVIFGLNFIAANGQILKNNLTIWSHWFCSTGKTHLRKMS